MLTCSLVDLTISLARQQAGWLHRWWAGWMSDPHRQGSMTQTLESARVSAAFCRMVETSRTDCRCARLQATSTVAAREDPGLQCRESAGARPERLHSRATGRRLGGRSWGERRSRDGSERASARGLRTAGSPRVGVVDVRRNRFVLRAPVLRIVGVCDPDLPNYCDGNLG